MKAARLWFAGSIAVGVGGGCATILDFDGPFQGTGGAASSSSSAVTVTASVSSSGGGSGGAVSDACVPSTSCAQANVTCGTLFDGCQDQDCGMCTAPYVCGDAGACTCPAPAKVTATLVADTAILTSASTDCGAITFGGADCINISDYLGHARGLVRFALDTNGAAALLQPGAVFSAKLTLPPAASCGGSMWTPIGRLDVHVMRNDWDEVQARWCHRSGQNGDTTTAPWGMPGASDTTLDQGPIAGWVNMPNSNDPFDIPLDPAMLASTFVKNKEISFLLLTTTGSTLVIQTREGMAPAILTVEYCPGP